MARVNFATIFGGMFDYVTSDKLKDKEGNVSYKLRDTTNNKAYVLLKYGYTPAEIKKILDIAYSPKTPYKDYIKVVETGKCPVDAMADDLKGIFTDEEKARVLEICGVKPEEDKSSSQLETIDTLFDFVSTEAETFGGVCGLCSGRGWIIDHKSKRRVTCPKCKGEHEEIKVTKNDASVEVDGVLLTDLIPNKLYQGVDFDVEKLEQVPVIKGNSEVKRTLEQMEKIFSTVYTGGELTKSYYVGLPDGCGKKYFAYSIIRAYMSHGKLSTPILDGGELLDYANSARYSEIVNKVKGAKLVVVSISGIKWKYGTQGLLDFLLELCERKGIPLIVLGRVNIQSLVTRGGYSFLNMFNPAQGLGYFTPIDISKEATIKYKNQINKNIIEEYNLEEAIDEFRESISKK